MDTTLKSQVSALIWMGLQQHRKKCVRDIFSAQSLGVQK